MNIGLFSPNFPGLNGEGGIGTYTRSLGRALVGFGHRVDVLTSGEPARTTSVEGLGVRMTPAKHAFLVDRFLPGAGACYRVSAEMRRLAAERRLDVVEFPNWEGFGLGFCAYRPAPVVVRLHTSSLETQQIEGATRPSVARWDVRREHWLAHAADALVTHSQAHRRRMATELGIAADQITVLPHGIEVAPDFRRPPSANGDLTVVYLGRMERRKGTVDLLQAVPAILRQTPRTRFIFIGADRPQAPGGRTHREYIRDELPAEAGGRVELLGRLPDAEVNRWLQTADVFVAPSRYESFGLIFLEAMRWGIPVVGTTAGGIPEIVQDGKTGILVPPGEPAALAQALVGLLENAEARRRLGQAGRCHVEENFAIERTARRVADFYSATLEAWRRRPEGRR